MLLRVPLERVFDQSICRTKEQDARLQCSARAMPKFVMPSGAKNGKVSKEKKRKNLAVLAKTQRLKRFFFQQSLSNYVKTVALTRAPENVGENYDIISKHLSHSDWLAIFTCYFSGVFVCFFWFLSIVRVNVVCCRVTL